MMALPIVAHLIWMLIVVVAEDRTESQGLEGSSYIGDSCEKNCSTSLTNAYCNVSTRRCECTAQHPIVVDNVTCAERLELDQNCKYDESCQSTESNSECVGETEESKICQCKKNFHALGVGVDKRCKEDEPEEAPPDVPTALGAVVGLVAFSALTCLVLRLFSRARFAENGHYANANLAPPTSGDVESPPATTSSHHHRGSSASSNHGHHHNHPTRNGSHKTGSRRHSSSTLAAPDRGDKPGSRRPSTSSTCAPSGRNQSSRQEKEDDEDENKEKSTLLDGQDEREPSDRH